MRLTPKPAASAAAVRPVARRGAWSETLDALRSTPGFWLLESTLADGRLGRFSFAGADPLCVVSARGRRCELHGHDAPARISSGDPFEWLRASLPPPPAELPQAAPPFVGGAVGWFGYELAAQLEAVDFPGLDDLGAPHLCWLIVDRALALEHASGRLSACALGFGASGAAARDEAERKADALARALETGSPEPFGRARPLPLPAARLPAAAPALPPVQLRDEATGLTVHGFFDEAAYAKGVEAILERIAAGDVYQANLTHRLDVRFAGDSWDLYTALRRRNPAPFSAFLRLGDLAIVGSSPERFLRLDTERRVESRPIKGTRPRGRDAEQDRALGAALRASAKDRAENVMIVDLVRNDLGRVCEIGSVRVPELFALEPYATVFQAVSTVTGRLRADRDALDLVRAAFPPGSMTGAPKIAATQILSRLEPVRRGIYAGALGYLDVRGGLDLSVVIRTGLVHDGTASLHVGGGIVADSEPAAEWQESLDKARALLDAIAERS